MLTFTHVLIDLLTMKGQTLNKMQPNYINLNHNKNYEGIIYYIDVFGNKLNGY